MILQNRWNRRHDHHLFLRGMHWFLSWQMARVCATAVSQARSTGLTGMSEEENVQEGHQRQQSKQEDSPSHIAPTFAA